MRELERLFSLKFLEAASGAMSAKPLAPAPAKKTCKSCMKSEPEISFGENNRSYTCLKCKAAAQRDKKARQKYMAVSYGIKPDIELKGNMK